MVSRLILSLKKRKSFYGSKIKLLSPAKINLYLNILGKYPKGFHQIESLVERVSLFDQITLELKQSPGIKVFSDDLSLTNNRNLCFQAADLVKKKFKIPFGFEIKLQKRIPLGSGLGGGSSNAAITLLGLNRILDLKLTKNQLYKLGAKLGSDVNFFLSQASFAFLEGRGEKVTHWNTTKKYRHFIIWPGFSASTKEVYKKSRVKLTKFFNNVKILKYALSKGDVTLVRENIFNVLENAALSFSAELRKAKDCLVGKDFVVYLTGSGSAFYTIGQDVSLSSLRSALPKKWRIFEAKTF